MVQSLLGSNALDDPVAEQALWPEQQEHQGNDVGEPAFDTAADERSPVELAELFTDADDDAAYDGTRDGGEAPEDQHGQGLEGDDLQRELHLRSRTPHNAGGQRHDAGGEPHHDPDLLKRDAD